MPKPSPNAPPPPSIEKLASSSGVSRRRFMQTTAGGALTAGMIGGLVGSPQAKGSHPHRPPVFGDDVLFLLNRISPGFSILDYQEAQTLGFEGFLEAQLDYESIDDSLVDELLANFRTLDLDYRQLYVRHSRLGDAAPYEELNAATLLRATYSKRLLFERMVEFFTDHFNINHEREFLRDVKTIDDRDVIRANALGKFPDMVRASARSGAMLFYLDNYLNTNAAPNENYGRELLELHTLGVEGPYEEFDVKNVSRCFTGWTMYLPPFIDVGQYYFDPSIHDDDQKIVLGNVIPPGGGESDGETVIDILTNHPSCARYLSTKMCRWLLGYDPGEAMIQAVSATYLSTGGDIKDMIRTIFLHHRMRQSDPLSRLKFKRPFHYVVSLLRAVQATIDQPRTTELFTHLSEMSHHPMSWPTPDGYPDTIEAWSAAMLPRWSFCARLMNGGIPGVSISLETIVGLMGDFPPENFAEGINKVLMGGVMAIEDVQAVQRYIDESPHLNSTIAAEAIALAASSPSFQYY